MKTKDEIEINGVVYVPKGTVAEPMAAPRKGMKYCIVRTYSAGVFAGFLESLKGKEATVRDARRIWYWKGAASLSQLAIDGTSAPSECKFPEAVDEIKLTEVIEVLTCTAKAKQSIEGVPIWQQ
jgi:hypothetical protein